jgi:hypothetical protein
MLCVLRWAVGLISVVVIRFRQKIVKLPGGGVSF